METACKQHSAINSTSPMELQYCLRTKCMLSDVALTLLHRRLVSEPCFDLFGEIGFIVKKNSNNKRTWDVKSGCETVSAVHVCLCHFRGYMHTHSCFLCIQGKKGQFEGYVLQMSCVVSLNVLQVILCACVSFKLCVFKLNLSLLYVPSSR